MKLKKSPPYAGFIVLSMAAHLVALYPAVSPGVFDFGKPVTSPSTVMVDLAAAPVPVPQPAVKSVASLSPVPARILPEPALPAAPAREVPQEEERVQAPSAEPVPPVPPAAELPAPPPVVEPVPKVAPTPPRSVSIVIQPPLRRTEEFLSRERETLTYQVKLRGVPVGTARLEASNVGGEFRISLKMNTAPALAMVYPVQSEIETRHIGGNFIITKIRRQEGTFRSDRGFTISLRDKSVFWADLIKRRSTTESVPTSEVLDPFSALYFLRNRSLEPGKKEVLHVYDGDAYAELPVDVLRSEQVHLPGKGDVKTLVVQPQLRQEAIFRRTGDMLIWLTDDEFKVPVKVETTMVLGKITAELVSAESLPPSDPSSKHLSSPAQ